MRKANERRKRAGQRNSCGAILGSFHRTSLIFSLNVAQWIERGIVRPILAILRSQTSSTGPVLKRQRTSTRSTALQNGTSLSPTLLPSCPPSTLAPAGVRVRVGTLGKHVSNPFCDRAHETDQTCALQELRMKRRHDGAAYKVHLIRHSQSEDESDTQEHTQDSTLGVAWGG